MLTKISTFWHHVCKCHHTALYQSCIDEEEKTKLQEKLSHLELKMK